MTDSRHGNVVGENVKVELDHLSCYDSLPPPIRRALADAPYSIAVKDIVEWIERLRLTGVDDYQIVEILLGRFRSYISQKVQSEAVRLYGKEHPQAGPQ